MRLLVVPLVIILCGCSARRLPPTGATAAGIEKRSGLTAPETRQVTDAPAIPPGVNLERPLSSDDAAALALWNNPQLTVDLGALGIAQADLLDAGLLRNPRLDMLLPVGAKPFELLLNLPIDAMIQRPRRVAAAEAAYEQLGQSLIQNGLNTIRDARVAHADVVQAKARLQVAGQAATLRDRIAELTGVRLKAGDISELETVQARAEAGTAQEQLVRFRHDLALAEERLRAALGLALARSKVEVAASPAPPGAPPPVESLIEKALAARPDLRAVELSIGAATKRARWERSRVLWLSAQLNSKEVGTSGLLTGSGVSVDLPIFQRNQGLVARAEAEVEVATRQYLALKQRIAFEVAESRELLLQSQEALLRTRERILEPLRRGATLAEEQYRRGDVSYLFVLEQTRGLIDAQLRVVDLEAAAGRAQAQLERSVGSK